TLANVLHLFPICSLWAQARPPIGSWCRPEDGLFGLLSGIIDWPDMEVVPDSFYGHVPVICFFPELGLSQMRGHKAYVFPNGAVTWLWGGVSAEAKGGYLITAGTEMATPSPGFQTITNGATYVDMVDRVLMRLGRKELVKEFYPSVKASTLYSMNLRPEDGAEGLISAPSGNVDPYNPQRDEGHMLEWFEAVKMFGMVTHIGGIHLAQLVMARRMAREVGDVEFARRCDAWIEAAGRVLEEKMWTGSYYLLYNEPKTGRKSDLVFGYQLDGDWMAKFHGLPGVFPPHRAKTTLETIRRVNAGITSFGAADLAAIDGRQSEGVGYGAVTFFVSEMSILAATYLYEGQREFGLELARRMQVALNQRWGYTWDQPNVLRGDTGEKTLGSQLLQSMFLWIIPAAVLGKNVAEFCEPGGLVDRMIGAARPGGGR
ncbi:MAG TPA: GH116 family glycosyl hydrolase, partial [Spirochaetia bacterium]|nr:GH116 family glycosyl hydrolase [Spirochaetia bacterium]